MDNQNAKGAVQQAREENYNPFSDNVKERDYTKVNAAVSPEQISSPIPEPVYQPQVIGQIRNPYEHISGSDGMYRGGGSSSSKEDREPINPGMSELPPHERKQAAEQLVDLGLSGYEMIFYFVNKSLQIDKKKVKKLQAEGKIDLNTSVPVSNGYVTAEQFINEYNDEVADTVGVSNKFKKDIKPPLTRILEKKGLGATDEQLVVSLLVMHLVQEGTKFAQAMQLKKDLLTIIQERTELEREQGINPNAYAAKEQAPKPQPEPKAKPQPKPAPVFTTPDPVFEGEEEPDADDFNFRSNEAVMNASVRQMQVPTTGKARLMEQRKREKAFAQQGGKASSYDSIAAKKKSASGKRGRPKKIVNTKHIAEAVVLKESDSDNPLD